VLPGNDIEETLPTLENSPKNLEIGAAISGPENLETEGEEDTEATDAVAQSLHRA